MFAGLGLGMSIDLPVVPLAGARTQKLKPVYPLFFNETLLVRTFMFAGLGLGMSIDLPVVPLARARTQKLMPVYPFLIVLDIAGEQPKS